MTRGQNKANHSSKGEFVKAFLEATFDIGKGIIQAFARESWHYKDLRIGGFDPDKIYGNLNNLKSRGILKRQGRGRLNLLKKVINGPEHLYRGISCSRLKLGIKSGG